jgi:hypothetical protein
MDQLFSILPQRIRNMVNWHDLVIINKDCCAFTGNCINAMS